MVISDTSRDLDTYQTKKKNKKLLLSKNWKTFFGSYQIALLSIHPFTNLDCECNEEFKSSKTF